MFLIIIHNDRFPPFSIIFDFEIYLHVPVLVTLRSKIAVAGLLKVTSI